MFPTAGILARIDSPFHKKKEDIVGAGSLRRHPGVGPGAVALYSIVGGAPTRRLGWYGRGRGGVGGYALSHFTSYATPEKGGRGSVKNKVVNPPVMRR